MNSFINFLEKFKFEVLNNKGHRHLYDTFDKIMQRLVTGEGQSEDEQIVIEDTIYLLISEAELFANYSYRYYIARCYICAEKLCQFIQKDSRKKLLQYELERLMVKIREKKLIPFFPKDFFFEYHSQLLNREQYDGILESIHQCFYWSDCGGRPRVSLDEEQEMFEQFKRGYNLVKEYLNKTHNYEKYKDWFNILHPIHIGSILASIPEDPKYDYIGDLFDMTLTMQIEMLEDWKQKSYDSFVANGGEKLLSKCLEY